MAKEENDGKTAAELQKALLDAERSGQFLYEELAPLWEQAKGAIESGEQLVSLYTSYIYLTRRHVDSQGQSGYAQVEELFEEAIDIFNECFADAEEDPFTATLQLEKNYAYFLYTRSKKPDKAREIWRRLLNSEQWPYPWLEAISLERAYGDVEYARQLFYRALEAVTARQGDIFGKFVQFEREEGTREQLDAALEKINAKAAEVNARVKQQQYKQEKLQRIREEQHHKGPQQQQQKRRMPNAGEGVQRNGQAANQQKGPKGGAGPKEKRRKVAEGGKTQTREEDAEMAVDREEKEPPKSEVTFGTSSVPLGPMIPGMGEASVRGESVEQKMELSVAEQTQESTEQRVDIGRNSSEKAFAYSAGLEKNKLFVKNLHFKSTGEELKNFFAQYGDVRDARIVTKWNGHSKGCAYVEFATDEGAAAALVGADEAQIHGRKINVYLSNPPARKAREQTANTEGTASEALGPTSSTESGINQSQPKTPAQPRKSHFAPRAAILAGGQRVGRGSNLALGGTISKAKNALGTATPNSSASPVGVVTQSTEQMDLGQQRKEGSSG